MLSPIELYQTTRPYKGQFFPIVNKEYERYILAKHTTAAYLLRMTEEQGELGYPGSTRPLKFRLASLHDWYVIEVDPACSFFLYHNLTGWYTGYDHNPEIPEKIVGYAKHLQNPDLNMLFFSDPNVPTGETQAGVFGDDRAFFVNLPEAYKEQGNLMITPDLHFSMQQKAAQLAKEGMDIQQLQDLSFEDHFIHMND